jgi:hypothetical protein
VTQRKKKFDNIVAWTPEACSFDRKDAKVGDESERGQGGEQQAEAGAVVIKHFILFKPFRNLKKLPFFFFAEKKKSKLEYLTPGPNVRNFIRP